MKTELIPPVILIRHATPAKRKSVFDASELVNVNREKTLGYGPADGNTMLTWFKSPYHRGQAPWVVCARLKDSKWVHCIGCPASLVSIDQLGGTKKLQVLTTWHSADENRTYARFYKQGNIAGELVATGNDGDSLDAYEFRSSAHQKTLLKGTKTVRDAIDRFFSALDAELQPIVPMSDESGLEFRHSNGRTAKANEFDELSIWYYAPVSSWESPASVALMAAIQSGDAEGVRNAIKDGASIQFLPDSFVSPLSISFDSRHPDEWQEIGKLLIDAGAPIDGYSWEDPPIFSAFAAMGKELSIIENLKLFLSMGADINSPARGLHAGSTLLHQAVNYNYSEVVRFLLSKGADVGIRNRDGLTALKLAERQAKNDPPCDLPAESTDSPESNGAMTPMEAFATSISGTPEQQIRRRAQSVRLLREAVKTAGTH